MKIKLLFTFFALSMLAYSQAPINNYFSEPMSEYAIVTGTIDHSPTGASVIWNFTALTASGTNTDTYAAPTAGELTDYPGTTEVLTITDNAMNENQFFYKVETLTLSLTGASNAEFTLNYNDDNALVGTYPLTYGSPATVDNIAGQIMAQGQSPDYTGTIDTEVDAYGTLTFDVAGQGNYSGSVTRIRTEQNVSFTIAGFFPGTATIVSYNYYKDADGALVFRTSDGSVEVPGLAINETFSTSEALITNTLSVMDNEQVLSTVRLYPNPVEDILNIELGNDILIESVNIIDLNGRVVLTSTKNSINTGQLQSGFYAIRIDTEVGSVTKKFIKR
ncbi:T9SS type A sorting domain-containing protein [Winogradskyella sp.]|uniref:T9SS type A sorting domain-containing protein n=2 Tax=Winogradskyella sp. TaxID=1883156 RepID=UPI0035184B54